MYSRSNEHHRINKQADGYFCLLLVFCRLFLNFFFIWCFCCRCLHFLWLCWLLSDLFLFLFSCLMVHFTLLWRQFCCICIFYHSWLALLIHFATVLLLFQVSLQLCDSDQVDQRAQNVSESSAQTTEKIPPGPQPQSNGSKSVYCAPMSQIGSSTNLQKGRLWRNPYHDEAEIETNREIIKCLQFQKLPRQCNKLITKLAQWRNLVVVSSTQKKRIWNLNKTFLEVEIQAVILL